ncbi:lipase [Bacillus vallismortis]|uniref:lipase n=1 Tax=Bacillus vallismortis TaxID=72361 RepID=UPI002DBCD68D|nr:lipase [Bacillus vallismortis]MEC1650708.1 lipase [Bacillus vallismortis]
MNTKTDIPNLSDEDYFSLSQNTYSEKKMKKAYENKTPVVNGSKNKAFYVDKIKKDPDTGLDVYVFVQAKKKEGKWVKPKEPENVVVGFQGTNQEQIKADIISADGGNVVMGQDPKKEKYFIREKGVSEEVESVAKFIGSKKQLNMLSSGKYEIVTKTSQFDQGDKVVANEVKKYAGTKTVISTTGHSLGGADAEYAAVNNNVYSVAFNNPSIVKLHDEETQKKIRNGEFDTYHKAIINPDDMVGAGWFLEYDRHNGTTIYTKDPSIARQDRANRLTSSLGIPGILTGLITTFYGQAFAKNPDTHSLNDSNFTFDKNGNIKSVDDSNGVYNQNIESFSSYSGMNGQTIKVDAKYAKELAKRLQAAIEDLKTKKQAIERFPHDHSKMVYDVKSVYGKRLGEFKDLAPSDVDHAVLFHAPSEKDGVAAFYDSEEQYQTEASLHYLIRDLEDISEFIVTMAEDLKDKDNELASWLRL